MTHPYGIPLALSLIAGVLGNSRALGKVIDDGPQHLGEISSIGESLRNAGQRPLHILYVHGMEALGAGDSHAFQKGICAFLKGCALPAAPVPLDREYADRGEFQNGAQPPAFEYMGQKIWKNAEEWTASAPFVDHYVLRRSDGGPVVIDEINWWPLVFPLKCRNIMPGEARLAGPDADLLTLCSNPTVKDKSNPGRYKTYQWLGSPDAATLKSRPHRGALINRLLKSNILDWGVSDAFLVVGGLSNLFRKGMRQLFVKSARFHADGTKTNEWMQQLRSPQGIDREFIVVSHSLGSYLVFSTLNMGELNMDPLNMDQLNSNQQNAVPSGESTQSPTLSPTESAAESTSRAATEDAAAQYILERTSLVYFFANQVALLELAGAELPQPAGELAPQLGTVQPSTAVTLSKRMMKWKDLRQNFKQKRKAAEVTAPPPPPQVVAWSDPSDLLSWYVPPMDGLKVDNLLVRNSWWHWLIANPAAAHGNYASNKNVLRIMMRP